MNYRGILTEEAVKGFREEGLSTAILLLCNNDRVGALRSIELDLTDPDDKKVFSISGKTTAGQAAMGKTFCGSIVNDKKWYPFNSLFQLSKDAEKVIREAAFAANCEPQDLEWALIEYVH